MTHQYQPKKFTVDDGLRIQLADLKDWKLKLNTITYSELVSYVSTENAKLSHVSTGYDVVRGNHLTEFVVNY